MNTPSNWPRTTMHVGDLSLSCVTAPTEKEAIALAKTEKMSLPPDCDNLRVWVLNLAADVSRKIELTDREVRNVVCGMVRGEMTLVVITNEESFILEVPGGAITNAVECPCFALSKVNCTTKNSGQAN